MLKATGCWGSKQPERHCAYARRQGWKHKAGLVSTRDGPKFYTLPIEQIRHMINSAMRKLNNSQARYELGRREPSLRGSDCNAAFISLLVAYEDSILVKLVYVVV
jgi:hypothetical protein